MTGTAPGAPTSAGDDDDALVAPFLGLPVDGVAISTLGDLLGSETVSATNPFAARGDEIQIDLGEGPVWEAVRTGEPELHDDLDRAPIAAWPAAREALLGAGATAVFAFPMRVGGLDVGAVTLYARSGTGLRHDEVPRLVRLTGVTASRVLARGLRLAEDDLPGATRAGAYSRRQVHQAVGMVAAQTGTTTSDAALLLRAAAFSSGRSVVETAEAVLARMLDLSGAPSDEPGGTTP
ncbi:GAF domain-containing protein [Curtobacterium sp. MCSS17_007]|uniref:GAF domain-containing protein n=1 Tax=Curtobacterium sp. MCSS17_007 TaxID=2175646 RepID=UPI0015E88801|nr:GAF domain-containing protein [Curtobacterium sp. MCSS17_007]WIE74960.1 GAF domain-containing protein [Curtobacterium sp. MCSS17_007]